MLLISLNKIERATVDEDGLATETTKPVIVNGAAIRCFYPRNEDKPGTRITFTDGGGFAVSQTAEEISALLAVH